MIPGFYHDNMARAYPFVPQTVGVASASGLGAMPHAVIADCGFVAGPRSGFVPGTNTIRLSSVSRAGATVTFTFTASGELASLPLVFTVGVAADRLTYATAVSGGVTPGGDEGADCDDPGWEGYVVFGNPTAIAAWIADGQTITGTSTQALVEPALIMSLAGGAVETVNLANDDRTRATAPIDCPELAEPEAAVHAEAYCVAGPAGPRRLIVRGGYNCEVSQDSTRSSLTFTARVGAGLGEPCGEIPLYEGEEPYEGGTLLDGSVACNEVVRSLAGAAGPHISVTGGTGATVTPDPENNRLVINIGPTPG